MKQVLQNLRSGKTEVAEVPSPAVGAGQLLIRTRCSLISAGTERMLVDFSRAGWMEKVHQQPDKVRMVIDKIKTDGLLPTLDAVRNKLDQPLAMGYCNVGEVMGIGKGVSGFAIGDRVVSNGRHAELVSVPVNLCVRVPETVCNEEAVFSVLGAIALQGIRLMRPTLGEAVVVTGLGLIGLIAVQLLRAHGCRVLGIDYDEKKLELAKEFGAEVVNLAASEDPVLAAQRFSRGRGVDGVLIAASTSSNEPVRQAALMSRKRGRIVLVGVAGLELSRADFYEKELSFQVSCSYGPGRYDPSYEEKGQDYPIGFVRWTEQRNFEAVLDMMFDRRIDMRPLISHQFGIDEADKAYELIGSKEPSLGIVLTYSSDPKDAVQERTVNIATARTARMGAGIVGFIGAGNYASAVLIPAFRASGARLHTIVSAAGVSALSAGRKYGFEKASTEPQSVLADPEIDTVVIATRHDTHAEYVLAAHAAGKHVFVEKPLCLRLEDLEAIAQAFRSTASLQLMVGFNRRFAPHVQRIKALLSGVQEPSSFVMTVNAGAIPESHWTQDPIVGGGRIVGECCHFVDLLRFLAGAAIESHSISAMAGSTRDTVTVNLCFSNGSIGTIHYFANGSKRFPKERLEIFTSNRVLQLDNFRQLTGFGWPSVGAMKLWRQDKGQNGCAHAFVAAVKSGGWPPISLDEIIEVSRVSIELQRAVR